MCQAVQIDDAASAQDLFDLGTPISVAQLAHQIHLAVRAGGKVRVA